MSKTVQNTEQTEEKKIDFTSIEKKWQKEWEKEKVFEVKEDINKKKYYILEMYPYPSANGLHIGHAFNYTVGDIQARFKLMQGFNVLHPMGYDSFGLPAENAAIKAKSHPKIFTEQAIASFINQQKLLGITYDWTRELESHKPDYYKWDQWIFLKMFEKGLAYKKNSAVNWCPKCNTVLANEQVNDGKCWRHTDTNVEIKHLDQWFLKITDYADELYEGINNLTNWPERIKIMQRNWIGKSNGTEILFEIENPEKKPTIFLVHGWGGNKDGNWFKWLKEQTKEKFNTIIPQFPNTLKPKLKDWISEMEKYKSNFDENTILIGHSLGCPTICAFLEKNKIKVKKIILVAPCFTKYNKNDFDIVRKLEPSKEVVNILKEYIEEFNINFEEVRKYADEVVVYLSKDDPYVYSLDFRREEYAKLNPTEKIFENKGHFNEETGVTSFPEILTDLRDMWPIFTTRPDTLYGVTFMVVSAQHPKLNSLVTKEQKKDVETFLKRVKSTSEKDIGDLEKEGVFTGSYAIHPITNKKIPVYAGNFVVADYGAGMVMAVPSHDQRDLDFAKKYKIEIKQVIAPYFKTTEGKDAIREDKKTEVRNSICGIVKHWKEDKYYLLDWKEFKWKSFILGGVEKGETPEEAVIREVKEETGYQDIKQVSSIGFESHAHFFAQHKDVNRYGKYKAFFVELNSDKFIEPKQEDVKNHIGKWVDKKDVLNFINLEEDIPFWKAYTSGNSSAYSGNGVLINSDKFDGMDNETAKKEITKFLEDKKIAKNVINFRLRDWLISRQRFWGTPIPIVYCDKCGIVPIPEKDLPVVLPEDIKFTSEKNPLLDNKKFTETTCPKCEGKARRETDTMDTFVNSSWYFLRYCDNKNTKEIFDSKKAQYWSPIDLYIGGAEHACMHLIYFRFYTKFLRDLELIKLDEPTYNLFNQGMVHGEDGTVMSKSKGNVIDPLDIAKKYSADTLRIFLVSIAAPDRDSAWSSTGIESMHKFIRKFFNYCESVKQGKSSSKIESKINKLIKDVSENISSLQYNLAIIKLRQFFETASEEKEISKKDLESFVKLMSPFCPHITEELWHKLGNKTFVSKETWPISDESKINLKLEEQEKAVDKTVGDIVSILNILKEKNNKEASKVYVYVMPNELESYSDEVLTKRASKPVKVFAVNDKNKYDPEGKSSKAKPGKPGIFVE